MTYLKKPHGTRSYPSSHTAKGYVGGCLFKKKFDGLADEAIQRGQFDKAVDLFARGQFMYDYGVFMGDLRKIVGVHHPSDVQAGRDLGRATCEHLWSLEDFKKDFMAIPL